MRNTIKPVMSLLIPMMLATCGAPEPATADMAAVRPAKTVPAELQQSSEETLKELRMLAALHGIGVIKLDSDNPAESQIFIPARERLEIDWANCNRLASENSDFQKVITLLWQFHRTGDTRPGEWRS